MSSSPKDRLKQYLRVKRLSLSSFATNCGIDKSILSRFSEATSQSTLQKLEENCDVNVDWLLTGDGEMLQDNGFVDGATINYREGVPYYDEDFALGFTELGFPFAEKPQFLVKMPRYERATLWCNATGHSMEPEICDGDVIALQLVEDPSYLLMGEVYAIVTTNGLRTIKRLGSGHDDRHYRLVATNPKYEEQEIPKDVILRVFKVLGSLHSF